MRRSILLGAAAVLGSHSPAAAQSLAERVAAAPDGVVRFSYAARPGVCGNGRSMIRQGDRTTFLRRGPGERDADCFCEPGPVRVALTVREPRVAGIHLAVGAERGESAGPGLDLGPVPAGQAAGFLLRLAADPRSPAAKEAIFPATLAEGVEVWPGLLRLARNRALARDVRRQAVFWLAQAAGDRATAGLDELAADGSEDREIREHAVFALSQLPDHRGVPSLLRLARTDRDPGIRRKALFWLGESDDPRALALFEELLTAKR